MRTRFQKTELNNKAIERVVEGFFEMVKKDSKLNDLSKFDHSNKDHLLELRSCCSSWFEYCTTEYSSFDSLKIYKLILKKYFSHFGSFKSQWIVLEEAMSGIGFLNEETINLFNEQMERFERNSGLTVDERVQLRTYFDNDIREGKKSKDFYQNILDNEYLILYRGFHAFDENEIRRSNDKERVKRYFKQKTGTGYSYTTSKETAFVFGAYLQIEDKTRNLGIDLRGRFCIGRYLVKKNNIFGANDNRGEREVFADHNKVFLVDYKFISNKKFEQERSLGFDWGTIDIGEKIEMFEQHLLKNKDHWFNKFWKKNEYSIRNKKLEELLTNS